MTKIHVSEGLLEQFIDEIINFDGIVVVDFFATWYDLCKKFDFEWPKLINEFKTVNFIKVDIYKNSELTSYNNIYNISNIKFFKVNNSKPKIEV
jgi:thioredoxin 1